MFEIVKNPKTDEVFLLDTEHQLIHGIDEAAFGVDKHYRQYSVEGWETLSMKEVPASVEVWRDDPGRYSNAHYVVARVQIGECEAFTGGGSIVYVKNYQETLDSLGVAYTLELEALYDDRNVARDRAEVAW